MYRKYIFTLIIFTFTLCFLNGQERETIEIYREIIDESGNKAVVCLTNAITDGGKIITMKYNNKTGRWSTTNESDFTTNIPKDELLKIRYKGKWGFSYIDGNNIIEVKYDNAGFFNGGLAGVKLDDKWGFIDRSGKIVVPFIYDRVGNFAEKFRWMAPVKLNDKWGFIDKSGRAVIPIKYDGLDSLSKGFSNYISPNKVDTANKTNSKITDSKSTSTEYSDDIELFTKHGDNGKWGFVDGAGKEVIPAKYDYVWDFEDEIAKVKLSDKHGLIDKSGMEITPIKYDVIDDFYQGPNRVYSGVARVMFNGQYGFINKAGKEVVFIGYDYASHFLEDLAYIKIGTKYGYINKSGQVVIPIKYDEAGDFGLDGRASVKLNGQSFRIDKNGNRVEN